MECDLYERETMKREIICGNLVLYTFEWDYIASNMYVIRSKNSMLIIDPVYTDEVITFLNTQIAEQVVVILTHEHFDHINGVNWLKEHFKCIVYSNSVCSEHICSEKKNLSGHSEVFRMFNKCNTSRETVIVPFVCSSDIIFDDNMEFEWEEHWIQMTTTPGHSDGSICILVDRTYLFTGDTLLNVPTVTRLPGGSRKKFYEITVPFLKKMIEKNYIVYPGHGEKGRLQDLLEKYL